MSGDARPFHNKILFCDVIGYSKLDATGQYICQRTLTQSLLEWLARMNLSMERDVIALPTGDGVALNFMVPDASVHLRAAISLLESIRGAGRPLPGKAPIEVRIGLNSHTDAIVSDINGKPNIVGHGINIAQRVMDIGSHGQVLLHDKVRHDLATEVEFAPKIHFLGEYEVKHGVRVPVSQYVDPTISYLNNDPPSRERAEQRVLTLEKVLKCQVQERIVEVRLEASAVQHLHDIRRYVEDLIADHADVPHLKYLASWVATEMLDNAFLHARLEKDDHIVLVLTRKTQGLVVEVDQPDRTSFSIEKLLAHDPYTLSFTRITHKKGFRWREVRGAGRHVLNVEIPLSTAAHPPTAFLPGIETDYPEFPASVAAFLTRVSDEVTIDDFALFRVLHGRIDQDTADDFLELVTSLVRRAKVVILDLEHVEYVSSAGLRGLMLAYRQAKGAGIRVVVSRLQPMVSEVFEVSRFNLIFTTYDNTAVAFRAEKERLIDAL